MKVSKQNALTFLSIISEKFVVKLFSTSLEISLIKLSLSFSVIFLPSKIQIVFRIVFPRSKTIAKPSKDSLTFETFIVKISAEGRFSFATRLLQISV